MFSEWIEGLQILGRYWPGDQPAPIWGWDDESVIVGVDRDAIDEADWDRLRALGWGSAPGAAGVSRNRRWLRTEDQGYNLPHPGLNR